MAVDFTGKTVNSVTVIRKSNVRLRGYIQWKCKCVCGKRWLVTSTRLRHIESCGCIRDANVKTVNTKHGAYKGDSESSLHRTWRGMTDRCHNKDSADYERYGARGIRVGKRWRESFVAFKRDMGDKPSPKHQIDREDNDGPYRKSNCRWVLPKVNCRNRRSNHPVTYKGRTMLIVEWAEETGLTKSAIASRLRKGWSARKALTTPQRNRL